MKLEFFRQIFLQFLHSPVFFKKSTTFNALDVFLEREMWGLFTLLPEDGGRSGW
jgi:hypothetical protein